MKNEIELFIKTLKMSTVDIAEGTGKKHCHVLRDAKKMLIKLYGEGGDTKFRCTYVDTQGKKRPYYSLPRNETLTLIFGYSVNLRMKIVQRMDELEMNERQRLVDEIGQKTTIDNTDALKTKLVVAKHLIEQLNLSRNDTVQLYCKLNEDAGLSTGYISWLADGSRNKHTLYYLFKKHGFLRSSKEQIEVDVFESFMTDLCMLDKNGRLCGEGLVYGVNQSPDGYSGKKMVPLYHDHTFLELYRLVHNRFENEVLSNGEGS